MPPFGLHMTAAREIAADLQSPAIEADRGAYYLGATTPDIRVLTKWDRERTHFFDIHNFGEQNSVHRMFEEAPALKDASAVGPSTAAFMAGYISHLELDEQYICQIYRPLFGERSPLANDVYADLMDRVLQFELDRREREDALSIAEIKLALAETAVEVAVDFISRETLLEWRDVSLSVLDYPPTWDRFSRFWKNHMARAGFEGEVDESSFMEKIPPLLDRTVDHVGMDCIREYLHGAKARARRTMKEYLS